jgi:hypothetical protein
MQKCSSCGTEFPENSRFCGKCGSVQDASATDEATSGSNRPQLPSGSPEGSTILATRPPYSNYPAPGNTPAGFPNIQEPITPLPLFAAENEDERRSDTPPWSPLYDATLGVDTLLGGGQAATPGAPVVQGTPQPGNVPSITGTPTLNTNAPVIHPSPGPGNALAGHPAPGPGNASIIHSSQQLANGPGVHSSQQLANGPVSHPSQQLANMPYPQTRPQPTRYPPEQPGTQERHTLHKHHERYTRRMQYTTENAAKVAGGSTVKTIIIVVVALVVVAAGAIGAAAHFLAPPQPFISITSNYKIGNAPAGASGTILHISGQQFASNSAITFLLDGQVAPGNPSAHSDANGNFSADVTITAAWSVGTHTLTARDANNNSTKNGVSVTIVQPGQANTPGPNGAPPDDASFKVIAQIQAQSQDNTQETEIVTGHPDPTGGTVCQPEDNGQPIVSTRTTVNTSIPYQETSTYSCAGNYKGGTLTLTETFKSDVIVLSLSDGTTSTCTLNSPQIDEQLSGSYIGNNTFSGTITYPAVPASDYSCNGNVYFYHYYGQHNWTGQVTDLHS